MLVREGSSTSQVSVQTCELNSRSDGPAVAKGMWYFFFVDVARTSFPVVTVEDHP